MVSYAGLAPGTKLTLAKGPLGIQPYKASSCRKFQSSRLKSQTPDMSKESLQVADSESMVLRKFDMNSTQLNA